MSYELTVKKSYRPFSWSGEGQKWEDEVEDFDDALSAIAALIYALEENPTKKITLRYFPAKD